MSDRLKIAFATHALPVSGTMVVFVGDDLALSPVARELLGSGVADAVARAAAAEAFKGKALSGLTLLAPAGLQADRLVVIGLGSAKDRSDTNYLDLGGAIMGRAGSSKAIAIVLDGPADWRADADAAADIALGALAALLQLRQIQVEEAGRRHVCRHRRGDDRQRTIPPARAGR